MTYPTKPNHKAKERREATRDDTSITPAAHVYEVFEQERGVRWTPCSLRVELNGGPRLCLMDDSLVGVVVGVREEGLPAVREGSGVHRKPYEKNKIK